MALNDSFRLGKGAFPAEFGHVDFTCVLTALMSQCLQRRFDVFANSRRESAATVTP